MHKKGDGLSTSLTQLFQRKTHHYNIEVLNED